MKHPKGTFQEHQLASSAFNITHLDLSAAGADEGGVHAWICTNPVSLHIFVQPECHVCVALHCTCCTRAASHTQYTTSDTRYQLTTTECSTKWQREWDCHTDVSQAAQNGASWNGLETTVALAVRMHG